MTQTSLVDAIDCTGYSDKMCILIGDWLSFSLLSRISVHKSQQSLDSTGYPSRDALYKYWASRGHLIEPMAQQSSSKTSAANEEAPQGKGVSKIGDWSFASSSGNSPSQDQMGWNMGAYSPSYDSEMAASYQQGDGSEGSDMELQRVSEPYPPIFIVQTSRGYKHSRMSATSDQYSLNQGPEAFGPEDWANYQMPSSTKGSHFKM